MENLKLVDVYKRSFWYPSIVTLGGSGVGKSTFGNYTLNDEITKYVSNGIGETNQTTKIQCDFILDSRIETKQDFAIKLSKKNLDKKVIKSAIFDEIAQLCTSRKYDLEEINEAVKNIHFPISKEKFYKARNRLVFDEIYLMQMKMAKLKKLAKKETTVAIKNTSYENLKLPFELTVAQKKVLEEVKEDMKKSETMNRLIQGDVGSGKTIVAIISSYIAIKNGYQSALMAPTEVLAKQHYSEIKNLFKDENIETVFLGGSLTKKQKEEVYKKIETKENLIVVGTHALIQDKVKFKKLGLVITDEQHRFGVRQRATLNQKGNASIGEHAHILVMTATPIPRTLGLILYGDLNVSIIDELPPNRQKIDTYLVDDSYINRIHNFIEKEVTKGRQAYIVCPMIENTNEENPSNLKQVKDYTIALQNKLKNITIKNIHGKMKQDEKDEIMTLFKENKIQVLVSTTVIEVGISVPNATLMIIENSERFGLSQLHQLRGRVGRGKHKSYCIMVSNSKSKKTKERLESMVKTTDGFILAKKDLQIRGEGEFFGNKQYGVPDYKIANIYQDYNVLEKCRQLYKEIGYTDTLNAYQVYL